LESFTTSSELQIIMLTVFLCSSFIGTRRFPILASLGNPRPLLMHCKYKPPLPKKPPSALDCVHSVGIVLSQLALLPREITESLGRRKLTFVERQIRIRSHLGCDMYAFECRDGALVTFGRFTSNTIASVSNSAVYRPGRTVSRVQKRALAFQLCFSVTLFHMHLCVSKMLGALSAVVRLYLPSSCRYVMLFDF
jgi:hypothetical protein